MLTLTYPRHRRLLVWIHWVVTCTAGCGGFLGLIEIVRTLEPGVVPPHLIGLPLLIAAPLCLFAMIFSQQVILERSGIPARSWIFICGAGFWAAVLLSMLEMIVFGIVCEVFELDSDPPMLGRVFACLLGLSFGLFQTAGFHRPLYQHLAWIGASGLAFGILSSFEWRELRQVSWPQIGIFAGLVYGVVTGTCLAGILPTLPEVAAERRYETWLAGRRKPARIDWSFLNRSGHPAA